MPSTLTNDSSPSGMTRWIVLAAGVVLQMILGGIYAWSAFVPPLVGPSEHSCFPGDTCWRPTPGGIIS